MEPGARGVRTAWVTVLASASWCQAGSLAPVTVLVGMGLTSPVMCVGEDVVQEDGGWVVFVTVQICPRCPHLCMGTQHLWCPLVTQGPPAAHFLPASPQTCCPLRNDPDSLQPSSLFLDSGSVEQLGGMELDWVTHAFDVKPWQNNLSPTLQGHLHLNGQSSDPEF